MQAVLPLDAHPFIEIAQGKDHPGQKTCFRPGRDHGVQTSWRLPRVPLGLDIVQQVHAEIIEPQIRDGNACPDVLHLDDFFLQTAQLFPPVGHVRAFGSQYVVVACGRDIRDDHAAFHPFFQADVFIQRHVGPVVDQLDAGIGRADTVYAAKALDDAHRIPVDVVIHQIVAILQVLAFGKAVRGNEHVYFGRLLRQQKRLALGLRCKKRQQL